MAIDTAAKRASVQAYATGNMRPPPDGSVSEGDRATVAWLYNGMNYDTPVLGGLPLWWFNAFYAWFWMR